MSSHPPSSSQAASRSLPASAYPLSLDHNALHRWSLSTRTIANYVRLEQIGEGTYGQVYRARPIDDRGLAADCHVALKKIRLHHPGYWGIPPTVLREIKILKTLEHPNMVTMLEVVSSKGAEQYDWEEEVTQRKKKKDDDDTTPVPSDNEDNYSAPLKQLADTAAAKNNKKQKEPIDVLRESYKGNLFLVLEYVSYDLTGLLDMAYKFTHVQCKSLMVQLLSVLEYMHEKKYVHRDLKSSNLLITKDFRVKLADFGLARCLDDGNPRMTSGDSKDRDYNNEGEFTNKVITLWYRPPELLLGETRYGPAVDIWSAGCILAEIILGRPIFTGKTEMDQLKLIFDLIGTPTSKTWEGFNELKLIRTGEVTIEKLKRPKLREKYGEKIQPVSALNLLEKLLELDPKKRISARAALNHRYFRVEPLAPSDPSELGTIELGDGNDGSGYHEFQTKKRRREAKAVAKQAEDEAKRRGEDVEKQKEAFDKAYREHLKKGAEKDKEKTKMKEKLEIHKRELEVQDQEMQLEMQMFPQQREFDRQQEGLQRMQQQHYPPHGQHGGWNPGQHHPGNPQREQYDRKWNQEHSHQPGPQNDGYTHSQSYSQLQQDRERYNHQEHQPSNMDDRRRDGTSFYQVNRDNWQQQPHQHPPFDRNSGSDWKQQRPPPHGRYEADDRSSSQYYQQQNADQRRENRVDNRDRPNPDQQQRPPFDRNTGGSLRRDGQGEDLQYQSHQQPPFERTRDTSGYRSAQSSYDREGRGSAGQQHPFDRDESHIPQQRLFDRNADDNRYGARRQPSFDRDGPGGPRDRYMRDQGRNEPRRDKRPIDGYDHYQRADGGRTRDGFRGAPQWPGDRYGSAPFGNNGWKGRDDAGRYAEQRRGDARDDYRNMPREMPHSRSQGRDVKYVEARKEDEGRFQVDREKNNGSKYPEVLQNTDDPLFEAEISLEAAEDLILRDFGGKGADDYKKGRSFAMERDLPLQKEVSSFGHRRERTHKGRHRDRSEDSRELRRSNESHGRSREHISKSRDNKEGRGSNASVKDHVLDRPIEPDTSKRSASAIRDSEHRSSSRHRSDRKRDGDDPSTGEHRHKRSRHDDSFRSRDDRHRSRDARDSRRSDDRRPSATRDWGRDGRRGDDRWDERR